VDAGPVGQRFAVGHAARLAIATRHDQFALTMDADRVGPGRPQDQGLGDHPRRALGRFAAGNGLITICFDKPSRSVAGHMVVH
jgi:hypothetical protein